MKKLLITTLAISLTIGIFAQGVVEQKPTLKVGMMSAVDIVPFYVAQEKGYFEEEGVEVELILFSNGQTRQTALQTGQVDGSMTDIISIITSNSNGFILKGTLSTDGMFPLLSTVDLEATTKINAGVMQVSVTNYLLDAYLSSTHEMNKIYINDIPTRLEALLADNIDVGIFPEPFASIGALRGVEKIVYNEEESESVDIIAFTEKALNEKRELIAAFHRAYEKAIYSLERGEIDAQGVLFASIPNLPPPIRGTIAIPSYKKSRIPSKDFIQELIVYTQKISGQKIDLDYNEVIDNSFIR